MAVERRKAPGPPGGTLEGMPEYPTAQTLMQTYYVELTRYNNLRLSVKSAADPQAFTREIGELPTERKKREDASEENLTEQVDVDHVTQMVIPAVLGRSAKLWLAMARAVIAQKLDPQVFMRRQFAARNGWTPPPLPNTLIVTNGNRSSVSAVAMAAYLAGQKANVIEVQIALRTQQAQFEKEVVQMRQNAARYPTDQDAWARVLDDINQPLSALFRYCLALSIARGKPVEHRVRFGQIAVKYATAAAIQYVYDAEAYDAVWKRWLPENYRRTADDLYRKYYGI